MPPSTPDPASATGLADAATAFEGLLTPASERTPTARPKKPAAAADSDTTTETSDAAAQNGQADDADVQDQDTTTTTQADQSAGDQDEGAADGPAQDQDDDPPPDEAAAADADADTDARAAQPPATVTVKVNGKEEKLPLAEVVRGYQRHADYSQKTQALAKERQVLHAEAEELIQERQAYAQLLPALKKQLEAFQEKEPDWNELYNRDPLEYVRQRDLFRDRADRIAAAKTEEQRLENLAARQRQQGLAQTVQQGRAKLVEAIPEWKDPKKWETDRIRLLKFGMSIGFSEDELAQTYDPRAVLALHKAMKYDALMANRPRPVVRTNTPRVAPAGSAESVPRAQDRTSRAKEQLHKTGSIKDAARVFEGIL